MSGAVALAVALSGAAVWAWIRPPPGAVLRRRLGSTGRAVGLGRLRAPRWQVWGRRPGGRDATARRSATIELCEAVADELRAGRLSTDALLASSHADDRLLAHAVSAARHGLPVAPALVRDAGLPGAEGLRLAAACWAVAEQHGGALAGALDRVAATLRAQELARRRVELELAAPRATARLLAALPVLGLVIGSATGANPLGVLLGTGWGWALLASGIGLDVTGLAWVGRIARAAERSG